MPEYDVQIEIACLVEVTVEADDKDEARDEARREVWNVSPADYEAQEILEIVNVMQVE